MTDYSEQYKDISIIDKCIIRPAELQDMGSVMDCIKKSFEPYISILRQIPNALNADLKKIIDSQNLFVATIDDKIVGTIEIIINHESINLEKLSVLPYFRGKGIGKKLISYAEFLAKENRIKKIKLFTNERLIDNIRYFKKNGFSETDKKVENGFKRVYFEKNIIG